MKIFSHCPAHYLLVSIEDKADQQYKESTNVSKKNGKQETLPNMSSRYTDGTCEWKSHRYSVTAISFLPIAFGTLFFHLNSIDNFSFRTITTAGQVRKDP